MISDIRIIISALIFLPAVILASIWHLMGLSAWYVLAPSGILISLIWIGFFVYEKMTEESGDGE